MTDLKMRSLSEDFKEEELRQIIEMLFFAYRDFTKEPDKMLEEIGETFDLTRERVRQIKEKAIRRLKHTSRSKILKTYLG